MIDFGVREVPPAGYVCRHGNGPEATRVEAVEACPQCLEGLLGLRVVAPRSRSGRVWTPAEIFRRRVLLWPTGGVSGFGGVHSLWKTLDELESWSEA